MVGSPRRAGLQGYLAKSYHLLSFCDWQYLVRGDSISFFFSLKEGVDKRQEAPFMFSLVKPCLREFLKDFEKGVPCVMRAVCIDQTEGK